MLITFSLFIMSFSPFAAIAQGDAKTEKVVFGPFVAENNSDEDLQIIRVNLEALGSTTFFSCSSIRMMVDGIAVMGRENASKSSDLELSYRSSSGYGNEGVRLLTVPARGKKSFV